MSHGPDARLTCAKDARIRATAVHRTPTSYSERVHHERQTVWPGIAGPNYAAANTPASRPIETQRPPACAHACHRAEANARPTDHPAARPWSRSNLGASASSGRPPARSTRFGDRIRTSPHQRVTLGARLSRTSHRRPPTPVRSRYPRIATLRTAFPGTALTRHPTRGPTGRGKPALERHRPTCQADPAQSTNTPPTEQSVEPHFATNKRQLEGATSPVACAAYPVSSDGCRTVSFPDSVSASIRRCAVNSSLS